MGRKQFTGEILQLKNFDRSSSISDSLRWCGKLALRDRCLAPAIIWSRSHCNANPYRPKKSELTTLDYWLVTFDASLDEKTRMELIRRAGAEITEFTEAIPLGDEVSIEIKASEKTIKTLRSFTQVRGIFPSSRMEPYKGNQPDIP